MRYLRIRRLANQGGPGWAFRNSGVMLHGQSAESVPRDQEFPVSIEGQFLGQVTGGGDRPTANLCTPATHVVMDDKLHTQHCTNSTSPTYMDDEWVTVARPSPTSSTSATKSSRDCRSCRASSLATGWATISSSVASATPGASTSQRGR